MLEDPNLKRIRASFILLRHNFDYLTEELSSNFKNWFGSSKVVDKNGEPLKVYHGTIGDFKRFDMDLNKKGYVGAPKGSVFFTNDPEIAASYSTSTSLTGDVSFRGGSNIIAAYLYMIHPLIVNAKGMNWDEIFFLKDYYSTNDIVHYAQRNGYDGVIIKNVIDSGNKRISTTPSNIYVVFDDKNIKSAVGNKNFNPLVPEIHENLERKVYDEKEIL